MTCVFFWDGGRKTWRKTHPGSRTGSYSVQNVHWFSFVSSQMICSCRQAKNEQHSVYRGNSKKLLLCHNKVRFNWAYFFDLGQAVNILCNVFLWFFFFFFLLFFISCNSLSAFFYFLFKCVNWLNAEFSAHCFMFSGNRFSVLVPQSSYGRHFLELETGRWIFSSKGARYPSWGGGGEQNRAKIKRGNIELTTDIWP